MEKAGHDVTLSVPVHKGKDVKRGTLRDLKSINGVPIRLTDERWVHIVENHDDLAGFYDEIIH